MSFLRSYLGLIIVLILSIPAILPFFHTGFFPMHDDTQITRVFEMGQSLRDGMFPVRWVKDLGYGYGYPIFNFYSPLPYYIGGSLTVLGLDALNATKTIFIIGILLSGIFMYYFVRSFADDISASLAGIIYVYFPYHAVNIYVRGALGELYAYAFLPLVFYGLFNIYKSNSSRWMIITALGIFFVILSHNLYSFILGLCLVVFYLLLLLAKSSNKLLASYFLALLLGLGLSAFFSIPAIFEMKYTNVNSQIGGGADYNDHFVCLTQLWNSEWGFAGSTKGCVDGMSFKLGKINILLLIGSLFVIVYSFLTNRKEKLKFVYISSIVLLLFSIFMTLKVSKPTWDLIPQSAFIQYPFRFLGFAGLFMSLIIGLGFAKITNRNFQFLAVTIVVIGTLFSNIKLFQPQEYKNNDVNFYTNKEYIQWTVSKISDEYMPRDFVKPASNFDIPQTKLELHDSNVAIEKKNEETHYLRYNIDSLDKSNLGLNIAYFPGWKLYMDGREINYDWNGTSLEFEVPYGKHILEAKFTQTVTEKIANFISIISVFLIILAIIKPQVFKFYGKKTS